MLLAVFVEQLLAPVPGGTGRYSQELSAALAAAAGPADVLTGWCAWHGDTRRAVIPGVGTPHRLPLGRRALALAWERGIGPVPHADITLAPTLLAPPRRGRPLVVTIHDAVPWSHPETLTRRGVRFHRRIGERVAREADAIIVPTRATADALAEQLPLRDERVHIVGEGVSDGILSPPADADARAKRLDLPPAYLLAVATLEPRKGLDIALAAVAALVRAGPTPLPLLIAGQPGWGGLEVTAEQQRLALGPGRVRVLGRLGDADLAVVLSRATALVAPSRSEGFGLPVLEAMAVGVAVVSSDTPALAEVGGGATLTVPVGDSTALAAALQRVSDEPELRAELVAAGRRRAADFSWHSAAQTVWELLRGLA